MFSRPVSSGWKPVPTSSKRADTAEDLGVTGRGLGDPREDLQERALAGAVAADDAEHLTLADLEGGVAEGPDDVGGVGLGVAEAAQAAEPVEVAPGGLERVDDRVANVVVPLGGGPDPVAFAEPLGPDGEFGHGVAFA